MIVRVDLLGISLLEEKVAVVEQGMIGGEEEAEVEQ